MVLVRRIGVDDYSKPISAYSSIGFAGVSANPPLKHVKDGAGDFNPFVDPGSSKLQGFEFINIARLIKSTKEKLSMTIAKTRDKSIRRFMPDS
jgi:hypothetical protein